MTPKSDNFTHTDSQLWGVSMRGWICFALANYLGLGVMLKIPIGTEFFTICSSVLVAYVVNPNAFKKKIKEESANDDEASKPKPGSNPS